MPDMEIRVVHSKYHNAIKKVAAYARVSTTEEEQVYSYEAQKQYYEAFIKNNPRWEFVGIYADKGISGTTTQRAEFQRLLADARAKRIDLILVKSISRFARNALDTQKIIHELSAIDVEIYFEEQKISSKDRKLEMILSIMAMVAENESQSISQNTQWALQHQAEQGIRKLGNRVFGYKEVNGSLMPDENAWAVKLIFEEFAAGKLLGEIVNILKAKGVKTQQRKDFFTPKGIRYILSNEIYKGDRNIQKDYHRDPISKKKNRAKGYDSVYVENAHEAIIDRKLWDETQKILEAGEFIGRRKNSHFLYGKVKCAMCGALYRRLSSSNPRNKFIRWSCINRRDEKICKNPNVKEESILYEIELLMGETPTKKNCKDIEILVEEDGSLTVIKSDPKRNEVTK